MNMKYVEKFVEWTMREDGILFECLKKNGYVQFKAVYLL